MMQEIHLNINGETRQLIVDAETPLLLVLRNDLGLKGPKLGCSSEQCNACKVLVDGADVPSCQLPVGQVEGLEIITVEGLGQADSLHPLQEAFIEEQAIQCGFCTSGMIISAQGLLNRTRYPTDDEIRTALSGNICRCGVYERVRRAIKLRIGRPESQPIFRVVEGPGDLDSAISAHELTNLPPSIIKTPELDDWIRIEPDGTISVFTGKVEIGQGIKTALAQIAAEELDVSLSRIRVVPVDTGLSPNEGITAGSMSLEMSGVAIRFAAAEARHMLLALAFEELEARTAPTELQVKDGTVTDPASGRKTTYWKLFGGQLFGRQISGAGRPKDASAHQIVGEPAKRIDLVAKVTGQGVYVHDMDMPGMVHGRVVRPPAYGARLAAVDDSAVVRMPGVVRVVRDGSFLAVVAEREEQAIKARNSLEESSEWEVEQSLIAEEELVDHLLNEPAQSFLIKNGAAVHDPVPKIVEPEDAEDTIQATYFRPYHMHGALGPSAAVAQLVDGQMNIWSHTQGPFLLRDSIAPVLGMAPETIRVVHVEGSGSYGHNGADDAALDAALLARAVPGRPVSVKWTRSDEHMWEPYGTAMIAKMQASLKGEDQISAWNHDVWSYPHSGRPRPEGNVSGLLAARHLQEPWVVPEPQFLMGTHFGSYRNADPLYSLANKRVVAHFVSNSPLRTSSLRGLGAYANVFAIESFIDELAYASKRNPVAYRMDLLKDRRAREVIEAAAEAFGWQPARTSPGDRFGDRFDHGVEHGRGIAFAQYKNRACFCAICVEVSVDKSNGQIQLVRAVIAADAGQIVNPDGLSNQLEGGFTQSASWTLMEQVSFDQHGILSRDWDSYPVLRFSGIPEIKTILINRPNMPFLGSGEAAQGPTAAAIANAIFDATGVRVRDLPIAAEKVMSRLP
jgi:nicotinate dehydrogenase subunit B